MRLWVAVVACAAWGCGADTVADDDEGSGGSIQPGACAISERAAEDGSCCPAGTKPSAAGCIAAGIPSDGCGEGFESDDAGGCEPLLPEAPCPDGEVALPGETACRPLMDCGAAPWGDIPSAQHHVDAAFTGASDGSASAPWTTIQQAIDAASPGAIVAVAEGQYAEDLKIRSSVRVFGRCPQLVALVGQGSVGAVEITTEAASGAELNGIAITGPGVGVVVYGPSNVLLDRLYVHDTNGRGVDVEDDGGVTDAALQRSLVERASDASVILLSASAVIRDTVIRDTQPGGSQDLGRGIVVKKLVNTPVRSSATISHSVIERVIGSGLLVEPSDASVVSTVIRDVSDDPGSLFRGRGVELQSSAIGEGAIVDIAQSLIERTSFDGIMVDGSVLSVDRTVIRDVANDPATGAEGFGIEAQHGATDIPSDVTVTASVIERAHSSGIIALASVLKTDGIVVRDILPGAAGVLGDVGAGITLQDDLIVLTRAHGEIRNSVVERTVGFGVWVMGSDVIVEGTAIADTLPMSNGKFGHGLALVDTPPTNNAAIATVLATSIRGGNDAAFGVTNSTVTVDNTWISAVQPKVATGEHGYGFIVQFRGGTNPAVATLRDILIEDVIGVGVANFAGQLIAERVHIDGVAAQSSDGLYGDGITFVVGQGSIAASQIDNAARAGVSNFAGSISMGQSQLSCNGMPIAAQAFEGVDYTFSDTGGNLCGCGELTDSCRILSADLAPPIAIEP